MTTPTGKKLKLVLPMEYDGKFTVSYNLDDGSSSAFRVIPEVGSLIVRAVNAHEELVAILKVMRQIRFGEFQAKQREAFVKGQAMDLWPDIKDMDHAIAKAEAAQ